MSEPRKSIKRSKRRTVQYDIFHFLDMKQFVKNVTVNFEKNTLSHELAISFLVLPLFTADLVKELFSIKTTQIKLIQKDDVAIIIFLGEYSIYTIRLSMHVDIYVKVYNHIKSLNSELFLGFTSDSSNNNKKLKAILEENLVYIKEHEEMTKESVIVIKDSIKNTPKFADLLVNRRI